MRSGKQNAIVTIWTKEEVERDPDYNTPVYVSSPFRQEVFCNITPRRGRENVINGQVVSETWVKFDFEFLEVEGITPDMWIVHEGVAYDISAILPDLALKEFTSVDTVRRG